VFFPFKHWLEKGVAALSAIRDAPEIEFYSGKLQRSTTEGKLNFACGRLTSRLQFLAICFQFPQRSPARFCTISALVSPLDTTRDTIAGQTHR